ncbi:MAG: gamma carbonic anhydrase family protein [Flavobacteriales bacterium]
MFYAFKGMVPVVPVSAFVHPSAIVIGHVTLGEKVYIGPGAVLRGDWGRIECGDGVNVQENCVVHMFPGATVRLEDSAHIGHGAIVHGAHVGAGCLVGMNAVLMDDVELGKECIVGALSFLKSNSIWASRSLIVGNPAQHVGSVSDELYAHKKEGTALYQSLPKAAKQDLVRCEPLQSEPVNRPEEFPSLETWPQRKKRLRIE